MERFFDYFAPSRYELDLHINAEKTELASKAKIVGEAKGSKIKLHAEKLAIRSLKLNGEEAEYRRAHGVIELEGAKKGENIIEVEYFAPIEADMEGVYLSTYDYRGKTRKMVSTQFESHYARECFPCVDEPEAKAVFKLTISSDVPTDTIISNMPAVEEKVEGDTKTVAFEETPKMSTYLVAFALGDFVSYETVSKHGVKITSYACANQSAKDLEFSAHFAADVLDFYDDCFKTPFPLPKMDLLAVPDFEAGAMENWGLVTFREIAMLANDKSSFDQKQYVAIVVAHELSHMWFGDLVTMKWWDDLWLNESFANMMESYATDKVRPELSAWDDFYTSAVLGSLQRDCLPGVQPVKVEVKNVEDITNLFDGAIVYGKGSRLLLMLMRTMGETNFFKGLADYFEKHKYSNTEANDLWDALSPYADFDVKKFMTPWLTQSGYPVITDGKQERFLLTGKDSGEKYPIRELKEDLTGHYLINLSEAELEDKLDWLGQLGREEKMRLLIDRRLLAQTKRAESVSLLPLLEAFANETDPLIWELLSAIINDLKIFFVPKSKEKRQFKKFVRKIALPNYERLGVKAKNGEPVDDMKLRPIIMALMHFAGDEEYIEAIEEEYSNIYVAKLNPDLRWIIASTLVREHSDLSLKYFGIYCATPDAALKGDLMGALTGVRDREIALSYFSKLEDNTIRPQDRLRFYLRLLRNHEIRKEAFDWAYKNWEWLYKEEGDKTIADYPRYMAYYAQTDEEAAKFKEFFKRHAKEKILARDIAVAFSEIDARLKLIASDKAEIYAYLAENC